MGRSISQNLRDLIVKSTAIVFLPALILGAIIAGLWPKSRNLDRTPEEVVTFLRDFIDGTSGEMDWDEFECVPIRDPELESIRDRAARAGPPNLDLSVLVALLAEAEQICAQRSANAQGDVPA